MELKPTGKTLKKNYWTCFWMNWLINLVGTDSFLRICSVVFCGPQEEKLRTLHAANGDPHSNNQWERTPPLTPMEYLLTTQFREIHWHTQTCSCTHCNTHTGWSQLEFWSFSTQRMYADLSSSRLLLYYQIIQQESPRHVKRKMNVVEQLSEHVTVATAWM